MFAFVAIQLTTLLKTDAKNLALISKLIFHFYQIEKPYPKRTQTLTSLMNFNNEKVKVSKNSLFSNMPTKKASSSKLRSFNDEDSDESDTNSENENKEAGKISFKDLCDEDKLKIANLVKELAK